MRLHCIKTKFILTLFINLFAYSFSAFEKQSIKIGKSYLVSIDSACKEISIPVSYRKSTIQTKDISSNMEKILITDRQIRNCTEKNIETCCLGNSSVCVVSNKFNSEASSEFNMNYCVETLYMYACISEKDSSPGQLTVTTSINNQEGCNTLEYGSFSECASLGLENCRDQEKCSTKCVYVDCLWDVDDGTPVMSLCLPMNVTDKAIKEKCSSLSAFKEEIPRVAKYSCSKEYVTEKPKNNSTNSFIKFLGVLLGLAILITIIASMYYRYKISYENTAPFEPPSFCPEILFPRCGLN